MSLGTPAEHALPGERELKKVILVMEKVESLPRSMEAASEL